MEFKPIRILLVEDNDDDVFLTRRAFKQSKLHNQLEVVRDGEAALDYLHRRGEYENAMVPDLVLLDWNLPRLNGKEVLQQIKEDESLRRIPVIVLTTSSATDDVESAYSLHANCYIVKPVKMESFIEVTQKLEDFWVCLVKLPG